MCFFVKPVSHFNMEVWLHPLLQPKLPPGVRPVQLLHPPKHVDALSPQDGWFFL